MPYDPYAWLNARYAAALAENPELATAIDDALRRHSAGIATNPAAVRYADATYQLAYALSHFAAGVRLVREELEWNSRKAFPKPLTIFGREVRLLSLGCGPGSDLAGVLTALGAVPRRLQLYAVDRDEAWRGWLDGALASVRAADPILDAAAPTLSFQSLDLANAADTEAYLSQHELRYGDPLVIVINRVLGAIPSPNTLMRQIVAFAPPETLLLVAAPHRDRVLLASFLDLLERSRRGACLREPDDRLIENHGWTLPDDLRALNNELAHKFEFRIEYTSLLYLMDTVTTLRHPGPDPVR